MKAARALSNSKALPDSRETYKLKYFKVVLVPEATSSYQIWHELTALYMKCSQLIITLAMLCHLKGITPLDIQGSKPKWGISTTCAAFVKGARRESHHLSQWERQRECVCVCMYVCICVCGKILIMNQQSNMYQNMGQGIISSHRTMSSPHSTPLV